MKLGTYRIYAQKTLPVVLSVLMKILARMKTVVPKLAQLLPLKVLLILLDSIQKLNFYVNCEFTKSLFYVAVQKIASFESEKSADKPTNSMCSVPM